MIDTKWQKRRPKTFLIEVTVKVAVTCIIRDSGTLEPAAYRGKKKMKFQPAETLISAGSRSEWRNILIHSLPSFIFHFPPCLVWPGQPYVCISLQCAWLLAKKARFSPRRFHSRAELECSRSPRLDKWLGHGCLVHSHDFLRFIWSQNTSGGRARLFWLMPVALVRFSTIQSTHLSSLFLSAPLLPKWQGSRNDLRATRTSSFVFQIYVFRRRENFQVLRPTTRPKFLQSFYRVQYIHIYIFLYIAYIQFFSCFASYIPKAIYNFKFNL